MKRGYKIQVRCQCCDEWFDTTIARFDSVCRDCRDKGLVVARSGLIEGEKRWRFKDFGGSQ